MARLAGRTVVSLLGLTMVLALTVALGAGPVFAQCTYQGIVTADNPIAYWRLGEDTGLTATNIGSLSPAANGTYENGVNQGVTGLIAGDADLAAGFDGNDDFVSFDDTAGINIGGPYTAKTVELWFSATGPLTAGTRQVLYEQGGINNGLNVFLDGNQLYVGAWAQYQLPDPPDPAGVWVSSPTPIAPNTTYHVVLVYEGSTGTVTGYLNGTPFGPQSDPNLTSIPGHVGNIAIGGVDDETRYSPTEGIGSSGDGDYFNGVIDEVALYNAVLSPERIQAHYIGCGSVPDGVDLSISKDDGGGSTTPGAVITYTLSYANNGTLNASNVVISDTVPANTTFETTGSTASWSCSDGDPAGTVCTLTVGAVITGTGSTVDFAVTVDDPVPAGVTEIANTASIADDGASGADLNPNNNRSNDTTPIVIQGCGYDTNVTDDNPIAYWRLGEATGLAAVNSGSLGGAVDGTYTAGVSQGVPGLIVGDPDLAAGFAGAASGADDMVGIPNNAAINDPGTYTTKTIELWFQANDVTTRQVLYEQGGLSRGLNLYIVGNNLYLNGWNTPNDGSGSPWGPSFISTPVSAGTPYHVVLVFEGDATGLTGTITGYLNGSSIGTAINVGQLYAHANAIGIGRENSESNYHDAPSGTTDAFPFNGVIDEVALYDYALPLNRIQLHASGCGTTSAPDLALTKDDGGASTTPGGTIIYTLNYINNGTADATGVVISDTVPANTTFNAGASSGTWGCADGSAAGTVCTFNVPGGLAIDATGTTNFAVTVVNPVPAGVTQIDNAAAIADDGNNGDDQNPNDNRGSDSTPISTGAPDLALTKDDGGASTTPGGTIIYTLNYINNGTADASGVVISDTVPANTTFNAGASSGTWGCADGSAAGTVCTFDVSGGLAIDATGTTNFAVTVVNPVPAGVTQIDNAAAIADDGNNGDDQNPNDNRGSDSTPVTATPDLAMTKTDGGISTLPGNTVVYALNYANNGNQGATGLVISDTVPANTTFNVGASSGTWSCADGSGAGTLCTSNVGGLGAGANATANFAVTVVDPFPSGVTQIDNTAAIADDGNNGSDQNPNDNRGSDSTPVGAAPDLALTKTDGGINATPGSVVTYTLSYANNGDQDATGVIISDAVPANTTFNAGASSGTWSCADGSGAGTLCTSNVGGLGAGANATANFAVTVVDPFPAGVTQIDNIASITDDGANGPDQNPSNNRGSDSTPVGAGPDLAMAVTDGGITTTPGGVVAYTLNYSNNGSQDATGVVVSDTLPANTSFNAGASTAGWQQVGATNAYTLDVGGLSAGALGATASGAVVFAVTVDDPLPAGVTQITNVAAVSDDGTNGPDQNPSDNRGSDTTPISSTGPEPPPSGDDDDDDDDDDSGAPPAPPPSSPAASAPAPTPAVVYLPETGVGSAGASPSLWRFVAIPGLALLLGWAAYRRRDK